jgi:ribosome-associated protein
MHPNEHDLNQPGPDPEQDPPSRSQLRREALDVLKLAQALADLSEAQLARVPLSDELRDEVLRTRGVTQHIARKRQTQFLAKQLRRREDELEPIRAALDHDRDHARREAVELHRVETWRGRLIAEGDEAITELLSQFPQLDRQQLRQLARQARAEHEGNKPAHAYRELFRQLKQGMGVGSG